jgi:hypothetical protein
MNACMNLFYGFKQLTGIDFPVDARKWAGQWYSGTFGGSENGMKRAKKHTAITKRVW